MTKWWPHAIILFRLFFGITCRSNFANPRRSRSLINESELQQVNYAAVFKETAGYRSVVLRCNLKLGDR
jgi:hypothetical protein